MTDMNLTRALNSVLASAAPVTDAQAARLASPAAFDELAREITGVPDLLSQPDLVKQPVPAGRARFGRARTWSRRRTLLAGLPLAALAGAAALIIGLLVPGSGTDNGGTDNGANSQAAIQALSFTKSDGYITVVIRNPYADAAWYNADFARHHLNITLSLISVSPSLVGTPLGGNGVIPGIKYISSAQRKCYTPGSGETGPCTIGFKIPADYHGDASIWIGRPAQPGEQYASTTSIFGPGEALAGQLSEVAGQPMSQVRKVLAAHHLTIAVCRDKGNNNVSPASVPDTYYLYNIMPWAPGQVIIWTSPSQFYAGSERVPGLPGKPAGGH